MSEKADGQNFVCPHCGMPQISTQITRDNGSVKLSVGNNCHDTVMLEYHAIACANPKCNDVTVHVVLVEGATNNVMGPTKFKRGAMLNFYRLRPFGTSKPQPDYIPAALREDYHEACLIRDLSPKAAATLARRCLQGMIRDFCRIAKSRLIDEIKELRARVDAGNAPPGVMLETVEAIDHVRSIGNIGAHMEKDIDLVIEVDPGEAQALINLIELLFAEWYVARRQRENRLAMVKQISDQKQAERLAGKEASGNAMRGPEPAGS
jgi:Domain of unknown function (DUF4145)